jgi:hypothetical protein
MSDKMPKEVYDALESIFSIPFLDLEEGRNRLRRDITSGEIDRWIEDGHGKKLLRALHLFDAWADQFNREGDLTPEEISSSQKEADKEFEWLTKESTKVE